MAVTAADIRATFPEFDGVSTATIDRWREHAERRVSVTQWGDKAGDGILWLTAHLLHVTCKQSSGQTVASGPVSSAKADGLSLAFAVPARMTSSWLASSSYGQYYLDLRRTVFAARVLGTCCGA